MKRWVLHLAALLIVVALPFQGISTVKQRLWMPAHYHLSPSLDGPLPQEQAAAVVAGGEGDALPVDVHPVDGLPVELPAVVDTFDARAPAVDTHQHGARHGHDHPPGHEHGPSSAPDSAHSSPEVVAVAPDHGHAHGPDGTSRHHHDRSDLDVVYVADHDAAPLPGTLTRTGFDAFWTLLPSRVVLTAAIAGTDPPAAMLGIHPSHITAPLFRPPRG